MRRRSLLVLLRQSQGLRFLPLFVGVCALELFAAGAPWQGEWAWTFDNINGATVLLGPVAASVAGWAVARSRLQAEVIDATARGWAGGLVLAAFVWASACLALSVTGLGAIGTTLARAHGGPAPAWVLAAGPAVLGVCVAAGALAGRFGPSRIYPLLIGPVVFGISGLGATGVLPDLLRQGPGTTSLAGITWNPRVSAAELVALLSLTAALAVAGLADNFRRSWTARIAFAVAAVVLVGAFGVRGTGSRFERSDEQPTRCASAAPRVCLAPSHSRALAGVVRGFEQLAPLLRGAGIELPGAYAEILPNHRGSTGAGEILLPAQSANSATASLADVADWLATPGDCPAYFDLTSPPPQAVYEARQLLSRWLLAGHGITTAEPGPLPPVDWVRSTFAQLRSCDLNAIRLPGRGGR